MLLAERIITYKSKKQTLNSFFRLYRYGLLHISEIDWKRYESMDGIFQVGDEVKVKLLEVDKQGKFKLFRKALLPPPPREEAPKA